MMHFIAHSAEAGLFQIPSRGELLKYPKTLVLTVSSQRHMGLYRTEIQSISYFSTEYNDIHGIRASHVFYQNQVQKNHMPHIPPFYSPSFHSNWHTQVLNSSLLGYFHSFLVSCFQLFHSLNISTT